MADRSKAPYLAQDPQEIGDVLRELNKHAGKGGGGRGGFSVRKKTYKVSANDKRNIDSWSHNDWDYKKPNLPTYARGLFTHSNNGKPEIVVRGYDKFFNVDEVRKTEWTNIEKNTRGPYELSIKENGCIIFVAGLDDETIVVTSKHSTGPRTDSNANHAGVGEAWLDRQLTALGKTRADLARRLREMNATAVAELCDDEFEEHVLEYKPEDAGLYLHGINLNLPEFATYPGNLVDEFADQWGFKKVQYIMKDTIAEVRPFLEEVAKTGNYAGRDTEGFVIRCQARDGNNAPWHDWFFKFKFEEPYLMYRQWREVTKTIIAGRLPKYHKHKKITGEYIIYARRQLAKDPTIGRLFNQNHGIIAMRDGFLKEKGLRGHEIIQSETPEDNDVDVADDGRNRITHNVVLAPIATIGCGKTTVAIALTKLFGWGHIQNDNIEGKARPRRFAQGITNLMAAHPVVIADRNNHQRRERAQLFEDVGTVVPETIFVALHWVHDLESFSHIKKVTQERVLSRGDKHQTIHPDTHGSEEIVGIMNGFLKRFEPCDPERRPDSRFDLVIDLDVTLDSRQNLDTIVHQLHDYYPKLIDVPSDEAMDQAINYALTEYEPTIKHELGKKSNGDNRDNKSTTSKGHQNGPKPSVSNASTSGVGIGISTAASKQKPARVEYFGIFLPQSDVKAILENTFASKSNETAKFFTQLKTSRRIQQTFHVTLIHKASASEHAEYWDRLNGIWKSKSESVDPTQLKGGTDGAIQLGKARVQLERIIWDGRVMTILTRILDNSEWYTVNESAHVTVGTASDNIKPKESNDLLKKWLAGGDYNDRIGDVKIKAGMVLEGTVRAMLSR